MHEIVPDGSRSSIFASPLSAHHMSGDWNPVDAFHRLAALSQVAHYLRHWTVDRYVEPLPDDKTLSIAMEQMAKTVDNA